MKTSIELTQTEAKRLWKAVVEEAEYCNKNNIPLDDGYIGVENLYGDDGYAYAVRGGFGGMATYMPYREAFILARKFI